MSHSSIISDPAHEDDVLKGILYVCTAFFLFTVMQFLAKLLTGQHHVIEIAFYRNLVAVIPMALYILCMRRFDLLVSRMPVALTFRVVVGTVGLVITFGAVQALPLANATVIFFTATLLTPVMCFFFLKEHVGLHRWIAVGIGMTGVLLVAQPTADLNAIGVALALGAACTHAFVQTILRYLKSENAFTTTFYFVFGGVLLPGILMPWFSSPLSLKTALVMVAIGVAGGIAQLCLSRGFQMAPASLLSPFGYTGLIWATGFDILIFQYVPGWPVFIGGALIIGAKLYMIYREKRIKQRLEKETVLHS